MEQRTIVGQEKQRITPGRAWQPVALALLFVLLTHQLLMASPLTTTMPTMDATRQRAKSDMPCDGGCPTGIVALCVPGRICAAVQATFARLPFTLLALVLLISLTAITTNASVAARRNECWLWPPDRRRAFLQVFLI